MSRKKTFVFPTLPKARGGERWVGSMSETCLSPIKYYFQQDLKSWLSTSKPVIPNFFVEKIMETKEEKLFWLTKFQIKTH